MTRYTGGGSFTFPHGVTTPEAFKKTISKEANDLAVRLHEEISAKLAALGADDLVQFKVLWVLEEIIKNAAYNANITMLARYDARNNDALKRLLEAGVQLRPYSQEILEAAEKASFELYDELAGQDADFKAIYEEWKKFREGIYAWNNVNEGSFSRYVNSKLSK